ncbi:MAG: hypothetical protein ACJ8LM_16480 [Candidatus Udaeobacter sp.]
MSYHQTVLTRVGASLCLLSFGVGWLVSARTASTGIPTVVGLFSPFVVVMSAAALQEQFGNADNDDFLFYGITGLSCMIGLMGLFVGVSNYYDRVEP